MVKSRRSNWDTILEMVPLIGEAHIHHMMLTEGVEYPEKPPIIEYYEHWRKGIHWLNMKGFNIDQVECYKRMIKNLS